MGKRNNFGRVRAGFSLPEPPGGKYDIPKRSPGKITKVETLSNHLEYHWYPRNGKNHKIGSL